MSEGRRAFLERVAGIEAGAECERLEPLLSALADGEAGAEELAAVRPHLKTCLSCRARLREYRDAPTRVAALVPPVLVTAGASGDGPGVLRSMLESIVGATQDKAAAFGERAHAAAELATGQKLAAVAASAAAIAGGAAGVEQLRGEGPQPARERPAQVEPDQKELPSPAPAEAPATEPPPPAPAPPAAPQPEPPPPDPATEFVPGPTAASASAPTPVPSGGFAPGGASSDGNTGGGEFGP